ncbi:sugar transferase [Staphylococcus sp. IVB6181]|mgnify:CR=1 FL=1|uniref:sugar transferase n=1 Tax=Staphylococcus TaxID=1279 RepID=UPI000D035417|nr:MULTISPECIES: sugar transferase [Staphylococcus]MCD8916033.1 sugar transferase [Staphylococcus simulans]UXV35272.1 sugar transferase [Staphylococcus sp. IVB6181]
MSYQKNIKRILDVALFIALLPILIVVALPVSLAIKKEDKGSILYNGQRLGVGMLPFKMHKFRTMKENAEDIRNADGSTFNSDQDPRVTKIGQFLRKSSIDELPQLLNVLKGDMSFVGPRPSPLGNEHRYPDYYKTKFHVKPGITGLTQALLRNSASMEERMRLDAFYAANVSFTMDAFVIYKTISTVLLQKNINQK